MTHFNIRVEHDRRSEIDDFNRVYVVLRVQQEILWFQVSMDDFPAVTVDHSWKELFHNNGGIILAESFHLWNLIEKFTTFNVFCDQVEVDLVLVEFIEFHNIWVVQLFQDINFIKEGVDILLTHIFFAYNFHGAILARRFVLNFLDLAIRTLT